jgi:hypothetical protein
LRERLISLNLRRAFSFSNLPAHLAALVAVATFARTTTKRPNWRRVPLLNQATDPSQILRLREGEAAFTVETFAQAFGTGTGRATNDFWRHAVAGFATRTEAEVRHPNALQVILDRRSSPHLSVLSFLYRRLPHAFKRVVTNPDVCFSIPTGVKTAGVTLAGLTTSAGLRGWWQSVPYEDFEFIWRLQSVGTWMAEQGVETVVSFHYGRCPAGSLRVFFGISNKPLPTSRP